MKNSMLFQNIDGNKSNFDTLAIELKRYEFQFSIIALAETNVGPNMSAMFEIDNYKGFYQETCVDKKKGSGVALYIHDSLNATPLDNVSKFTKILKPTLLK